MHSENLRWDMDRGDFLRLGGAGLAGAVLLGTVGAGGRVLAQSGTSVKEEIESAATEYKVPKELLLAMGYVNTRWEMPPPTASDYQEGDLEGRGDYGIMALVQNPFRDTLGKAATLTGLTEKQIKTDRAANIRGGAAVLATIAGETKPSDLNGWQEAVAEYGGGDLYAREVYETLASGASAVISTGERVDLYAKNVEVPRVYIAQAAGEFPGSVFYGAHPNNYTVANREASHNINKIIIHVAQGSYSSAINWFRDPRAYVSAHYTVRHSDGFIGQSVRHKDIGYHAGNWNYNTRSIGIEHSGYVSNRRYFTRAMYRHSARLTAFIARRHRIPISRRYIIGHSQVPGSDHTDPGKYWDWRRYIKLVRSFR